jgi:hypothetical protein
VIIGNVFIFRVVLPFGGDGVGSLLFFGLNMLLVVSGALVNVGEHDVVKK